MVSRDRHEYAQFILTAFLSLPHVIFLPTYNHLQVEHAKQQRPGDGLYFPQLRGDDSPYQPRRELGCKVAADTQLCKLNNVEHSQLVTDILHLVLSNESLHNGTV